MALKQLDAAGFEEVVYNNREACLVIFSRKECHVCKEVVPVLEQLQPNYAKKFGFYYVDVEEDKSLFQRFSLKGVPQILYFNGGEYRGKQAGKVEDDQVEDKISDTLK